MLKLKIIIFFEIKIKKLKCFKCDKKLEVYCKKCEKYFCNSCLLEFHNHSSTRIHLDLSLEVVNVDKREKLDKTFGKLFE